MEIAQVEKGDLKAVVKFEKGAVIAHSVVESKGVVATLEVKVSTDYFLDELAKAIPGQVDDAVIALLKTALKAI